MPITQIMEIRVAESEVVNLAGRNAAASEIYTLAYTDALTGARNRAFFEMCVHDMFAEHAGGLGSAGGAGSADGGAALAFVLFVDLDRFKIVNDTLGHAAGDTLLRVVSERIQSLLRPEDTLARLGGDEFAMLLPAPFDQVRASTLAARIIDLVQRAYLLDGNLIHVGASIGIAVAPDDGSTREQLLRSADLALYHSKGAGRGVFHFFAPAMAEKAQRRRTLELDLRRALVLRQFEMLYQPQIDAEAQTVIGLEGLIRWRHPKRGLMAAEEFLPLAEEIGIAAAIGDWMLKTACKEATCWPETVTISVNISPHLFENSNFAASVERALTAAQLPGNRFEIDVTEDILLRDGEAILETLGALRKLGVSVAMDRFGTGLASMGQLVNFRFDKIKIDPSLSDMHHTDGKNRAIIRAVSALGECLGISTFAEGVQDSRHLAEVRAEGSGFLRGFYYSPPVQASELHVLYPSLFTPESTPNR